MRLFLNGTAVVQDNAPASPASLRGGPVTRTYAVQLADGPNVLQAEAYNAENSMHSSSATASIAANLPPATRANLHAVVVGIQEFKNSNYNLTYPVKDAQLFAETLSKYSAPLFEKIDVKLLVTTAQTTREALLQALKDMQAIARPDDLFVFYVASHGIADDGEYFLITSNVGSASTEHLKSDAVSKEELTALVANIPGHEKADGHRHLPCRCVGNRDADRPSDPRPRRGYGPENPEPGRRNDRTGGQHVHPAGVGRLPRSRTVHISSSPRA